MLRGQIQRKTGVHGERQRLLCWAESGVDEPKVKFKLLSQSRLKDGAAVFVCFLSLPCGQLCFSAFYSSSFRFEVLHFLYLLLFTSVVHVERFLRGIMHYTVL